ncbi:hypothetical protein Poly30_54490 [Planctomycetes bacterium Poly30]|uniref:Uncharacterized protein n=1 Tax=Saltatorellus ferox TaxID=2528018 RepID=A0A518F0M3_9BACT|nr:hypothetical protein Poly30_54490 [Planctomycetes bacterium Poly30]
MAALPVTWWTAPLQGVASMARAANHWFSRAVSHLPNGHSLPRKGTAP